MTEVKKSKIGRFVYCCRVEEEGKRYIGKGRYKSRSICVLSPLGKPEGKREGRIKEDCGAVCSVCDFLVTRNTGDARGRKGEREKVNSSALDGEEEVKRNRVGQWQCVQGATEGNHVSTEEARRRG